MKMRTKLVIVSSGLSILTGCYGGSNSGSQKSTDSDITYTVGGTVTGLNASALTLGNGSDTITVTADGSFTFPTALPKAASYNIVVKSKNRCIPQTCTVTNGSGVINDNISSVQVSCSTDTKVRFFATNWSDQKIRVTDDLQSLADGGTATPREITGFSNLSKILNLAINPITDTLYVIDGNDIKVVENVSTAAGPVNVARIISVATGNLQSVVIDPTHDLLYVSNRQKVFIFKNASTLNGSPTPDVVLDLTTAIMTLNTDADTLYVFHYVAGEETISVFENASTLTSSSTAQHTATLTGLSGSESEYGARGIWIDSCLDRLYIVNYWGSTPSGEEIFAFDNASTLSGTIAVNTGSRLRAELTNSNGVVIDPFNNMITIGDGTTTIRVHTGISSATGALGAPNKILNGVINKSTGLAFKSY